MPGDSPSMKWGRALVFIVAAGLGAFLIKSSVMDLKQAMSNAASLYSKRVVGLSVQGDLQFATQESRRTFLYIFTTTDRDRQLSGIDRVRQADLQVSLLTGKSMLLGTGPGEAERLRSFEFQWNAYLETRDDVLALLLQRKRQEALALELADGAQAFDRATAIIRNLKSEIDRAAAVEKQSVTASFRRAVVELIGLTLAALVFMLGLLAMNRRKRRLVHELTSMNEKLALSEQLERQRRDILEQVGRNEGLVRTLGSVASLLSRQWPECSCAVVTRRERQLCVEAHYRLPAGALRELESIDAAPDERAMTEPPAPGQTGSAVVEASREAICRYLSSVRVRPILSSGGQVLGEIILGFSGPHPETLEESEFLETATQLAAIATEQRRLYDELAFQARHDSLTGLPNRMVFEETTRRTISEAEASKSCVGVLWIDLDRFKKVNDCMGHHVGDRLLHAAGQRLKACVRTDDTVARIGGDEFTVALAGIAGTAEAVAIAERIRSAFQEPFRVSEHQLAVTASIGISVYPEHGEDWETLSRNADAALHIAKRLGRSTYSVCEPGLGTLWKNHAEIESRLAHALENGEFRLQYQPQVDSRGRVVAAEALLRWHNQALGDVSPTQFIPIAERSGLIVPIGAWVLNKACVQAAAWNGSGFACRLAVNVSALQFSRTDFDGTVAQALTSSGLDARLLELELTETALMRDLSHAASQVVRLRNLGVAIAVDDFGTGYCSLAYLQQLPVNAIKLDQSFLRGIAGNSLESGTVLEAILMIARSLNLSTVAEGVECEIQLEFLKRLGCDLFQGFLFHRPMDAGALTSLLRGGAEAQTDMIQLGSPVQLAAAEVFA